jgi:hypothetical protein
MTLFYLYSVADSLGTTFYVDFSTGSDANDGQTPTTAWKHCPGDANATGNANRTMQAGDTFLFRGGIRYRGQIVVNGSGTAEQPITIKGDGWGSEPAIIDGGEPIKSAWRRCSGPADCHNNTNWSAIWVTEAPTNIVSGGLNVFTLMSLNDVGLRFAQSPNPSDALYWDYDPPKEWQPVNPVNVSTNWLVDTSVFTSADTNYYEGAYVAVWVYGNAVKLMPITSYSPDDHKIGYDMGSYRPYTDRVSYFTLIGHPGSIDIQGEYSIRTNENRLYYWPMGNSDPNTQDLVLGVRAVGILSNGKHNILIEGLRVTGINGSLTGVWSDGSGIVIGSVGNPNSPGTNLVVRNNEVFNLRTAQPVAAIDCPFVDGIVLDRNKVHDNSIKSKGIRVSGRNVIVVSNELKRISGTGIYFAGVVDGLISHNVLYGVHGTHANGISIYQSSSNVTTVANRVWDAGASMLTFEQSADLLFINNVFDACGADGRVYEWSGMRGYVRFFNNTFVNNPNDAMLMIGNSSNATYELRNNIIDGGAAGVSNRSHNIYVGLLWNQMERYGWSLASSERVVTNINSLFASPASNLWELCSGSAAIDAGTNLQASGISVDIRGISRESEAGWDIGAYEWTPGGDDGIIVGWSNINDVASYPQSVMDEIGQFRWYFEHASVGQNMRDGVGSLRNMSNTFYQLININQDQDSSPSSPPAATTNGIVYCHWRSNPGVSSKINLFATSVTNGWRFPKVNLAMNKFCYIDISVDFNAYVASMTNLESRYPETVFVYATQPITTTPDNSIKTFNNNLRTWVQANNRVLFDIADIEAHDTSGVEYINNTCQVMYAGNTSDGGHLNAFGSQEVAKGFYAVCYALLQRDRDGDGMSDGHELMAGTCPTIANSCFQLRAPSNTVGGMVVSWPSASNRTYVIERATNLLSGGFTTLRTNAATPPMNCYTDVTVGAGSCFYRLRVSQ